MAINISVPNDAFELKPRITVVGTGGAGGNAVNNMIRCNLEGVEFVVANSDAQAIAQSPCTQRIQLGANVTRGLGAGSRPEIGRAAAEEALDEIMEYLHGSNMVFVTAGMGGGTGTGAAPVIARAARESGILTVGVVTKPFHFEGAHRMRLADAGIEELQQVVDTLIVIPNQNLFRIANDRTTFADAFRMADDVLYAGVRGITDLMIMPGLINLDFADIRTVMMEMGKAMMGTGEAEGENRATAAAEAAISNPLLDDVSMKGAKGVLINITGGYDMTLFEIDEAANRIREEVDPDANIIFGSTFDQSMEGKIRLSIVATGIDNERLQRPAPLESHEHKTAGSYGMAGARRQNTNTFGAPMRPVLRPTPIATPKQPSSASVQQTHQEQDPHQEEEQHAAEQAPAATIKGSAFVPPEPVQAENNEPEMASHSPTPVSSSMAAKNMKPSGGSFFSRISSQSASTRHDNAAAVAELPASSKPAAQAAAAEEEALNIPAFLRRTGN